MPKPSHLRQRQNKKSSAAELVADGAVKVPNLPNPDKRTWHRLTRLWWKGIWQSPMAGEFLESDVFGLARLAVLIDDFNTTADPKLMTEIRLQEARFGLAPVDRSRLQWEVQKGEEAESKRRNPSRKPAADTGDDPRAGLKVVS